MWTEPVTMLTDYGLGALCGLFALRLWAAGRGPMRVSVRYWAGGMGALAAASFAGGTVHGWSLLLAEPVLTALWKGTALAVGLAACSFFLGTVAATVPMPLRRWWMAAPSLQFAGYVVWMTAHDDFRYVVYNYGLTFAVILLMESYRWLVRKAPAAGWTVAGVLVTFLAAFLQQSGIALHPSFNHNDLYHVVQMAGMTLLYRGAALLEDR